MAPGFDDPEGGGIAILPRPYNFTGCPSFERNGPTLRFQMRGLEQIFGTRQSGWGPDSSLIRG